MVAFKVKEKIFSPALDAEGNAKNFSDDAFYVSDDVAVVFDGATGLGSRRLVKVFSSDPEWMSNTAVEAVSKIKNIRSLPVRDVLKNILDYVLAEYEKVRFPFNDVASYEKPSSTMVMAKTTMEDDTLELTLIADGALMWESSTDGFDLLNTSEYMEKECGSRDARFIEMGRAGTPVSELKKIFLPEYQAVRSKMNKPDGYGVVSIDYDILSHHEFKVFKKKFKKGDKILISSDGLLRYADAYHLGSRYDFFKKAEKSLSSLLKEVRDFEHKDISCSLVPRFKASDDVSAIFIEVV